MSETNDNLSGIEADRERIQAAREEGTLSLLWTYIKLAGPGWMQSAITIGGASLGGSLFLGVIGGAQLLWIQPVAVIMGVCMLSTIAYVALSSDERPFDAMINHVNPVLAWGWLVATVLANCVWAIPQFGLATAALRQNLFPNQIGSGVMDKEPATLICAIPIAIVATALVWLYDSGLTGVKIFEWIIRLLVACMIFAFIGVVIKLSFIKEGIDWSRVLLGYIPDISLLWSPPDRFIPILNEISGASREFWRDYIVSQQQDKIITVAAAAVGINMTFLMPYSMLKKGWDEDFRGLAIFDLATGMLIPFLVVTGCIVIASMHQFHTKPVPGLVGETKAEEEPPKNIKKGYRKLALKRINDQVKENGTFGQFSKSEVKKLKKENPDQLISHLSLADRKMAARLVHRDAFALADSLEELFGPFLAQIVFGIGVVGVAISTILMMMLINGFAICEALGYPSHGWVYKVSAAIPGFSFLVVIFWEGSMAYLVVPTSIIGMILLPIAYLGFWIMMNQRSLLGDDMPTGQTRVWVNVILGVITVLVSIASVYSLWKKYPFWGFICLGGFIVLALIIHVLRE